MHFSHFLKKIVQNATGDLPRDERQKSLLLSSMLLCFSGLIYFLTITHFYIEPENTPVSYIPLLLVSSVVYTALFFLSKTKYYRVAGHLWLFIMEACLIAIAATDPREASVAVTVGYAQIAVIISSVIFSIRETILWSVVLIICVIGLPVISPHVPPALAVGLAVMLCFTASLSVLNSYLQATFVRAAKDAEREATCQKDLVEQNLAEIESMFAQMKLGVFTLGRALTIQERYSVHLEEILGRKDLRGQSFDALFLQQSTLSADERQVVGASLEACIEEDEIFFKANEHLLPTRLQLKVDGEQRLLEVSISPIIVQNVAKEMLVILRDITQLEALKASSQAQNIELEKIWRILKLKRNDFLTFINSSMSSIEEAYSHLTTDLSLVSRNLHTLKGHSRIVGFNDIAVKVHEIESTFCQRTQLSKEDISEFSLLLANLRSQIGEYGRIFAEKIGGQTDSPQGIILHSPKMLAMASSVFSNGSSADQLRAAHAFVTHLYSQPFGQIIEKTIKDVEKLALLLGKEAPVVEVGGMQTPIAWNLTAILDDACIHLIRNSVDHGIEVADVRRAKDKPSRGTISLVCEEAAEHVLVTFRDDGAGLDFNKIKARAVDSGLLKSDLSQSRKEILELIFSPRFSTKAEVTEISGLGIGLDAVKRLIEGRGGKVELIIEEDADDFYPFSVRLHLPSTAAMMKLSI